MMIEVQEYIDTQGRSPFAEWVDGLNAQAALKINTYLTRITQGNLSNIKSVGSGVQECRINWGQVIVYILDETALGW